MEAQLMRHGVGAPTASLTGYNQLEGSLLPGPGLGSSALLYHDTPFHPPPLSPAPDHHHQSRWAHRRRTTWFSVRPTSPPSPGVNYNHILRNADPRAVDCGLNCRRSGPRRRRGWLEEERPLQRCQPGSHISVKSAS